MSQIPQLRHEILRLGARQLANLSILVSMRDMIALLESEVELPDHSRAKFTESTSRLDEAIEAEILREALPRGRMTTLNLCNLLAALLAAGDDGLPRSTIVEKAGLWNEQSINLVLGSFNGKLNNWLRQQGINFYFGSRGFSEHGPEGMRMPAHLRDVVREYLEISGHTPESSTTAPPSD